MTVSTKIRLWDSDFRPVPIDSEGAFLDPAHPAFVTIDQTSELPGQPAKRTRRLYRLEQSQDV